MSQLLNLTHLSLGYNSIIQLPESLYKLKLLKELYLEANPIINFPFDSDNLEKLTLNVESCKHKKPFNKDCTIEVYLNQWTQIQLPEICKVHSYDNWQAKWLLNFKNAEDRMFFIKALGYERIMEGLSTKVIHKAKDDFNNIMELHFIDAEKIKKKSVSIEDRWGGQLYEEDIVLLKVVCPSTNKIHVLRVPHYMKYCEEARRWTLFDEENRFNILIET